MSSRKFSFPILLLAFAISLLSCKREKDEEKAIPQDYKQKLEKINKVLVDKDTENIQQFINRREWNMKTTKSGLWYMVYEKGDGKKVAKNNSIELKYKTWLIDGTLIYDSDSLGTKIFIVGQGGVEPGLEEGVLMLEQGSRARFILPPHLAFGLLGDENRVPGRAILVYDIEIIKVEK